jgi:hypothetical protein
MLTFSNVFKVGKNKDLKASDDIKENVEALILQHFNQPN